METRIMSH